MVWIKYSSNPVLGGEELGVCFDVFLLKADDGLRMYFSWRDKKSLAVSVSQNGIDWGEPKIILEPLMSSGWEDDLNRNCVVFRNGVYHMWYTGQARGGSCIGYATSADGYTFARRGDPVIIAERWWEKRSVMNPHVIFDEEQGVYKMWYCGGETYEPDAIGYAVSTDGIHWEKHPANPVFTADASLPYEKDRVGACQVIPREDGYWMFYIGYEDIDTARICLAKSPDGITRWERIPQNPLISPSPGEWDAEACYKPFAIYAEDKKEWRLYYNGRRGNREYIGFASKTGNTFYP
ncbi:MAG: hypothetical protein FWG36_10265 [Oscillospiraceae bacterium]|nr:hypothetical protein [Oscillospiraceae bacterium]